jgi:aryl-alcohol dehydrogenase-like predicted oxidoreductase
MSTDKPSDQQAIDRRRFLQLGATAGFGLMAGQAADAGAAQEARSTSKAPTPMPTRNLGKTGHRVKLFSLGGQGAVEKPENADVAVPIVERAIDLGVNYIDTAARYGGQDRWSQRYIGQVMARRRKEVFLATKTHDRTAAGSRRLLEESLRLLHTDHLDLWQIHNLEEMDEVDQIFAKGGAIEAMQKAREEKLVRFIGVTGHADPAVLMEALRRFPFDTLLLALNAADPHHLSFATELLPMAVEKKMGIIGMKIPARGRLLSSGPSEPGITMREAMDYVLSLPVSTVIVGCDSVAQLEENVQLARSFNPMTAGQMTALASRAEPVHREALFFRRWT